MSKYDHPDRLRDVFTRAFPDLDPSSPLHAAMIQESWEASDGDAEAAHAAMHTLTDDCLKFAAAIVVMMPDA